jgi:hypothetical protein
LTHVSVEMRIREERLDTERASRINGINKSFHEYEQTTNIFHKDRKLYKRPCKYVKENQVCHSGREDTPSPIRNGANLRQLLILSCSK